MSLVIHKFVASRRLYISPRACHAAGYPHPKQDSAEAKKGYITLDDLVLLIRIGADIRVRLYRGQHLEDGPDVTRATLIEALHNHAPQLDTRTLIDILRAHDIHTIMRKHDDAEENGRQEHGQTGEHSGHDSQEKHSKPVFQSVEETQDEPVGSGTQDGNLARSGAPDAEGG